MADRMPPSDLASQVRAVARKAVEQKRTYLKKSKEDQAKTESPPGAITTAVHMVAGHIRNLGTTEDIHTYCKGLLSQDFDPAEDQDNGGNNQGGAGSQTGTGAQASG